MTNAPSPAHPAFRLAEKHFKNRATAALPALRDIPTELCRSVLDLSRPASCEEDEVYLAGWWGRSYEPLVANARKRKVKDRARGERPPLPDLEAEGVRVVQLNDGRAAYIVAEGESLNSVFGLSD